MGGDPAMLDENGKCRRHPDEPKSWCLDSGPESAESYQVRDKAVMAAVRAAIAAES